MFVSVPQLTEDAQLIGEGLTYKSLPFSDTSCHVQEVDRNYWV